MFILAALSLLVASASAGLVPAAIPAAPVVAAAPIVTARSYQAIHRNYNTLALAPAPLAYSVPAAPVAAPWAYSAPAAAAPLVGAPLAYSAPAVAPAAYPFAAPGAVAYSAAPAFAPAPYPAGPIVFRR